MEPTVMVTVHAMNDELTHLSRLGTRTLCGKRAKFETARPGEPCPVCARRASRKRTA